MSAITSNRPVLTTEQYHLVMADIMGAVASYQPPSVISVTAEDGCLHIRHMHQVGRKTLTLDAYTMSDGIYFSLTTKVGLDTARSQKWAWTVGTIALSYGHSVFRATGARSLDVKESARERFQVRNPLVNGFSGNDTGLSSLTWDMQQRVRSLITEG